MTSLDCRRTKRYLSRLRDHAGTEATVDDVVRSHCSACPACRRFAETLDVLDTLGALNPSLRLENGVLAERALNKWQAERAKTNVAIRHRWAAGAVALSGVAATAGYWMLNQSHSPADQPVAMQLPLTRPTPLLKPSSDNAAASREGQSASRWKAPLDTYVPAPTPDRAAPAVARGIRKIAAAPVRIAARGKKNATAVSAQDDLAFINADSARVLNEWAALGSVDQARLEAQIRASLAQGDDFVSVPFPRVASLDSRSTVRDALTRFRYEASIVDSRLQRNVSLQLKQESFAKLCERLSAQTGMVFSADPTVADDNIVLYCTDRSVRDIMRQISRHFGFTWRRDGDPGAYRYTLTQELAAQIAEEELRNRDRSEAILSLDTEMQKYRPFLNLTPDQALEKMKTDKEQYLASMKTFAAASDAERAQLTKDGKDEHGMSEWMYKRNEILTPLSQNYWAAIHLYFQLTPEQRAALRRGEEVTFTSNPQGREGGLTPYLEKNLRESLRGVRVTLSKKDPNTFSTLFDGAPADYPRQDPPDDPNADMYHITPVTAKPGMIAVSAFLKVTQREPGIFDLNGGGGFGRIKKGKAEGYSTMSRSVAEGRSPSVLKPVSRPWSESASTVREELTGQRIQHFKTTATSQFQMIPLWLKDNGDLYDSEDTRVSAADVWERIHQATGQDVLSDGFTRLVSLDNLPAIEGKTLPDALNMLGPVLGQRWRAATGENGKPWVLARSASFFNDRSREVPRRLWEAWAAKRRERGYATADLIAEMATLSDAQLDSKASQEAAVALYGLREWSMASTGNFRQEWRLYQTLSEEQRRKVWSATGLPFKELSLEQQDTYLKRHFPTGIGEWQRSLYMESGRFIGRYTSIPDAQRVKRANIGKPYTYNPDVFAPRDEPKIVWAFTYGEEGKASGSTYSYAP